MQPIAHNYLKLYICCSYLFTGMKSRIKEFTIYDIAQELNISPATVSRGLKDHPAISAVTKKRINDYAKEIGYQANKFATALRKNQTNTIGVIVHRLDSQFVASALAGMEKVAAAAGYYMIISQSLEQSGKEKDNAEVLFHSRVDGLIVSLAFDTIDLSHFKPFIKKGIPMIFFDRVSDELGCPSIVIDNFNAGYTATMHLIEQGCTRIAHITGNTLRNVYADRLNGYKKASQVAGLEINDKLIFETKLDVKAGNDCAEEILKMEPLPDGIFAANDLCGISCMQRLKMAGIKIPEDIAIVGFNNDPIASLIEPKLTTIDYPSQLIGETAARQLLEMLPGKILQYPKTKTFVKSELIIRESSVKLIEH